MKLSAAGTVLMVGIAGSGMRGLAYLLQSEGARIVGVDNGWRELSAIRDRPEWAGMELVQRSDEVPWEAVELVIFSDAVAKESVWRKEVADRDLAGISYQKAVGEFSEGRQTIAVAGTHGKSSTTAFLAYALLEAGLDPAILLGARAPFLAGGHAQSGRGSWFLTEADEYRGHFLTLRPKVLVLTSIDFDHTDYFADLEAVVRTFDALLTQMPEDGVVIVPESLYGRFSLSWPKQIRTVREVSEDAVEPLPGRHMQMNAALAMEAADYLGVPKAQAAASLERFPGLERRFEELGSYQEMTIVSDYGHHPSEIRATVAAARRKWPGRRIGVLWEPHMAERVRAFRDDFVRALREADGVWLYPVYRPAGREGIDREGAEAQSLLEQLQGAGVPTEMVTGSENLERMLRTAAEEVEVLLAFTAGNLDGDLRTCLSI